MRKLNIFSKTAENFNLNGVTEVFFWKSEWESFDPVDRLTTVSVGYVIYRFAFMAYFVLTLVEDFICSADSLSHWFIFLTNLTYTLQTIHSIIFFVVVVLARLNQRKVLHQTETSTVIGYSPNPKLPWLEKLVWILVSVVNTIPFGVTIIYWIFLFHGNSGTTCSIVTNYFVHLSNALLALLDNLIIAVPTRVSHAIFPMTYALCYLVFSGLYEVAGGSYEDGREYIYDILDWKNNPGWAMLTSFGGLVFAGIGHLVFGWGVYRLRLYMVQKFTKKNLNHTVPISNVNEAFDGTTDVRIETSTL